jgi:hypothetical protein
MTNTTHSAAVQPIFNKGKVPKLEHCEIQDMRYDQAERQWKYFIRNNYNPWGSGWGTEDFIIQQIKEHGK